MNIFALTLLAFAALGTTSVAVTQDCVDLAGNGHVCAAADAGNVDVDVLVEPQIPPVPPTQFAAREPTCVDLAGQGSACAEATADPGSGNFDVDTVVVLAPTIPPL